VKGAGGHIAAWILNLLLGKGYNRKGTVRNPGEWSTRLQGYEIHGWQQVVYPSVAAPVEVFCSNAGHHVNCCALYPLDFQCWYWALRSSCGVLGRHAENSKHLLALYGTSDGLQLVAANLRTPGAFDSIFEGCDGVFHIAAAVPGSDDSVLALSHLPS
jgi:hypothetical protein